MEHLLRNDETLKPSISEGITDQLLEQLMDTKERIEKQREDGYIVAIVHLSGDMMTSSHVQYMNTIRAKVRKEINKPFKLLVGVEADTATEARKNKTNIQNQEERKYMFENLKGVDKSFIQFEGLDEQYNNRRPAGIVQYLGVDVFISHSEHIQEDEEQVRQQAKEKGIPHTVVINYGDEEKYLGEKSMRSKFNRSTTNTVKQILQLYKDHPKYQ